MTDHSELIKRLLAWRDISETDPKGCKVQMAQANHPYPCMEDCPCALSLALLDQAAEIERLRSALETAHAEEREACAFQLDMAAEAYINGSEDADFIEKTSKTLKASAAAIRNRP